MIPFIIFVFIIMLLTVGDIIAWYLSRPTCYKSVYYVLPLGGYVALIDHWRGYED